MKKRKRLFGIAFVIVMTICVCGMGGHKIAKAGTMQTRAVWVSCFEFEQLGLCNQSQSKFTANVNKMFKNIRANGCNTVYFHVRSHDDAIYPSSVVSWSKTLLAGGSAPSYDPLKILVASAHQYGLKFHAWMNPYRITSSKILNPASPATNDRIVNQVKEIINRYNVDGIHFDDYFYPSSGKKYKSVSKAERKANVNQMVRKVYQAVKAKNRNLKFGISPAGDISYCEEIGADVKTWMSTTGYIDYIVPQIYWSNSYLMGGKKTALFNERFQIWQSNNKLDLPMYIGLALYKAGYSLELDPGWKNSSKNLANQLKKMSAGNCEGYVLFSYVDLYRDTAKKEVKNYLAKIATIHISNKKKTIRVGKKFKLRASIWPSRCASGVKWKSGNKKIATVTSKGLVKGKKKGKVRIYAYYGSKKVSCTVQVKARKKK